MEVQLYGFSQSHYSGPRQDIWGHMWGRKQLLSGPAIGQGPWQVPGVVTCARERSVSPRKVATPNPRRNNWNLGRRSAFAGAIQHPRFSILLQARSRPVVRTAHGDRRPRCSKWTRSWSARDGRACSAQSTSVSSL